MRKIGVLLLFVGIALGLLYPWAKVNLIGNEVVEVQLANLDFNAKQSATINLERADNPMRARFFITYKEYAHLPPQSVPVFARIDGPGNLALATIIKFPTGETRGAPEQKNARVGNSVDFDVKADGLHQISLELAPNPNSGTVKKPAIEYIKVKFVAKAASKDNPFQMWGLVIGVAGIYLMLRTRREQKTPGRWGRGNKG